MKSLVTRSFEENDNSFGESTIEILWKEFQLKEKEKERDLIENHVNKLELLIKTWEEENKRKRKKSKRLNEGAFQS
jgi:hypothetical protein